MSEKKAGFCYRKEWAPDIFFILFPLWSAAVGTEIPAPPTTNPSPPKANSLRNLYCFPSDPESTVRKE